jgi:hypothetical protein
VVEDATVNTIPSELIAVPNYHGYYWHPGEGVVYSMKVDGILKPLKKKKAFGEHPSGYPLSRKGKSSTKPLEFFRRLTPQDYKVPYQHEIRTRI